MTKYTILLPPSEGKADGGRTRRSWPQIAEDPKLNHFASLNPQRQAVIDALYRAVTDLPRADLEALFGVKDDALDAALAANRSVLDAALLPAIERYTGVMFDFLDYAGMDSKSQRAFRSHTILFSGLWGLLRPGDLIPDYKLKIDAALPEIGLLTAFWKPHIGAVLNPMLTGHVVWDLLPGAHSRAWDGKADVKARWSIKFVERVEKKGKLSYRTVSHWSKALKGALVRYICANGITHPRAFVDFQHPQGYVYAPAQSEEGEIVFVKESGA